MNPSIKYSFLGLYFISMIVLSYCCYPGASVCEEDTQIYLPILLNTQDGSLLKNDLITRYPHTAFTLFDESVLFLSRSFGLSLASGMTTLQIISRCLLLVGFFLIFKSLECPREVAFGLAGLLMMGGAIPGVQTLIVEYESVPRGIAFSLSLLALALVSQRRVLGGTFLACLGLWVHPTTTLPFWIGWATILPSRRKEFSSSRGLSAALLVAAALLLVTVALGSSPGEQSRYFLRLIDPVWENLLKLRVPYVFVSEWDGRDFYLLCWAGLILCLACWRCRLVTPWALSRFVAATGGWASIMVPVSWILLDHFKMALFPQLQPARALIFMVVFMLIFSWTAAVKGLEADPLKLENHLWVLSALFFSLDRTLLVVLWPLLGLEVLKNSLLEKNSSHNWGNWVQGSGLWVQLFLIIFATVTRPFGLELLSWHTAKAVSFGLVLSLVLSMLSGRRRICPQFAYPSPLILTILLFLVLPSAFRKPASTLDRSQIRDLAAWAKSATPMDAVFLFPDAGQGKWPGVFRYYANRAVYVDWKSGGQINFSRSFAMEWWERWETTMRRSREAEAQDLRRKGVDFVVTQEPRLGLALELVHESNTYYVYRTR